MPALPRPTCSSTAVTWSLPSSLWSQVRRSVTNWEHISHTGPGLEAGAA